MNEIIEQHAKKVTAIQERVRDFYSRKETFYLYHGRGNSTREFRKKDERSIDIKNLDQILSLNVEAGYIVVEPNIPMDALIDATLAHGLVPPVVVELPNITVASAIQSGGGESSSPRYKLFHDNCLEYEMILGNGDLVTVSPEKNSDLFWGTACSFGSLGIITSVKLRLVPAKPFIRLSCVRVRSFGEMVRLIQHHAEEKVPFVDGIMFSAQHGVVMLGEFSDKEKFPVAHLSRARDEWFYLHAQKVSSARDSFEEVIPTKDYMFRYDRGAFWMGRFGFRFLRMPFSRVTRFLFHVFCTTRALYRSLQSANYSQRFLIQDVSIPVERTKEFLEYTHATLQTYPLWLCPLLPSTHDLLSPTNIQTKLVINVGIWDEVKGGFEKFLQLNRNLEKKVQALGGRKALYAHTYYPPDEFWKIYDQHAHKELRRKYHADTTIPDLYEMVHVAGEYKTSLASGILSLIKTLGKALLGRK